MALPKIYDKTEHQWHNNTTPAINEDELNAISFGLSEVDDRVISLAGTIMETVPQIIELYDDIETLTKNPPYIGANGNWYVWDTSIGDYVDSGIDASITVTIADVTMLAPDATPYVTNTGTDTDPIFHLFIPRGEKGETPDISSKMDAANPTGTGSFSLNRKSGTTVGTNSFAEGGNTTASGNYGHSEGYQTTASGDYSHAEGYANNSNSSYIQATGQGAHVEGYANYGSIIASGQGAHAEGYINSNVQRTEASGKGSHAEGSRTIASGDYAHAEGYGTTAAYNYQHVGGEFNSNKATTLFEIGNGTSASARSNAFEVYSDGSISMDNGASKIKVVTATDTVTLSTSNEVTVTFTNSAIKTDSAIDVYTSEPNLTYKTMSISAGSCSVTFDKQSSASTITVKIYIK